MGKRGVVYPEIDIINNVTYYRYTPREQFQVKGGGALGGSDQVNYFHYGSTTEYNFNRLWGGSMKITGPVANPPDYFTVTTSAQTGYVYNLTQGKWLFRGTDVPEDMFG